MSGRRVRRRPRARLVALLAVGVVATAGVVWGLGRLGSDPAADDALDVSSPTSTSSAPTSAAASAEESVSPATPARRAVPVAEAPARVRLPSGTTVAVVAVSTRGDGLLDVPDDIRTAGWWRGGARLGDPFGSTLIAAHIDSSTQGLGPYAELLRVRRGERIVVTSTHLEQRFAVASLRLVPRASLAGATDLFAPSGPRRLTMVTCAGPYDAARGGYQNLAVVTARPVAKPRSRDDR
jgi:sortase family protein